jgi:hypothetical protein
MPTTVGLIGAGNIGSTGHRGGHRRRREQLPRPDSLTELGPHAPAADAAGRSALPIAGDHPETQAAELIHLFGYDTVDVGTHRQLAHPSPALVYIDPYLPPWARMTGHPGR